MNPAISTASVRVLYFLARTAALAGPGGKHRLLNLRPDLPETEELEVALFGDRSVIRRFSSAEDSPVARYPSCRIATRAV